MEKHKKYITFLFVFTLLFGIYLVFEARFNADGSSYAETTVYARKKYTNLKPDNERVSAPRSVVVAIFSNLTRNVSKHESEFFISPKMIPIGGESSECSCIG